MRVSAKLYRGIEFVNESDLPADQQLLLQHNAAIDRIKILMDGKIVGNCIQYTNYCSWYSTVFEKSIAPAATIKKFKEALFEPEMVLKKV